MSEKKQTPPPEAQHLSDVFATVPKITAVRLGDTLSPDLFRKSLAELATMVGNATLIQDAQFLAAKRLVYGRLFEDVTSGPAVAAVQANMDNLIARASVIGTARKTNKSATKEEVF